MSISKNAEALGRLAAAGDAQRSKAEMTGWCFSISSRKAWGGRG